MISLYRVLLALHVIAIISWMAGILYLFRLFVYHAQENLDAVKERFMVMERKLYQIITLPAMVVAFLLGIGMVYLQPYLLETHWFRLKVVLVLFLMGVTHWSGRILKDFARSQCKISSKTFRFLNEIPTLLMIGIVLLVILKPF
ncbi:MAG: protoporphyrinogen oxidase HemJ [Proteobacteria bacterium]|nr:protoporphyrinogen oxidase HemJ [Pseudomonadota bacterium]